MFVKNDNSDAAEEPNIVLFPQPDGMENASRGSPAGSSELPQLGDLENPTNVVVVQHENT